MSIERKCENCIYFGMKSHDGMECCLPTEKEGNLELCNYADFTPREELIRRDEKKHWKEVRDKEVKEAFRSGMAQAYFDIGMVILNGTHNYKDLQDYCINKSNEIGKKEK